MTVDAALGCGSKSGMKLASPSTLQEERDHRVLRAQCKATTKAEDEAFRPERLMRYDDPDFDELSFVEQFVPTSCDNATQTAWRISRRMGAAMPGEHVLSVAVINQCLIDLAEAGRITLDRQGPSGKFYTKAA